MNITREQYTRRQTRDARSAMALALARHLTDLEFSGPTGHAFRFTQVFDEWPSYNERYVPPAACVLPGPWRYADARLTPTLVEDSVEPMDTNGNVLGAGFGLYKLADLEADFELYLRAPTVAEREALIAGVEQSFRSPRILLDFQQGARYGVILSLPEYFGLDARFAIMSARVIDDEDRAMREHREAVLTISGQAPQVAVGPVRPFKAFTRLCEELPDGSLVDVDK